MLEKISELKEFLSKLMFIVTLTIGMVQRELTSIIVKLVRQSGFVKVVVYFVIKIMIQPFN